MQPESTVLLAIALSWMLGLPEAVNCKRILIITPVPLYSHQLTFQPLWLALQKQGHELVVVAIFTNATLRNYTEINISSLKNECKNIFAEYRLSKPKWETEKAIWSVQNILNKEVFEHPQMRRLYAPESNEKFDLVIVETLAGTALFSFAHRFHAPLIGISSSEGFQYIRYLLGDLFLPSYPSNWEFDTNAGFNLSFWQRSANYLEMLTYIYRWTYFYMPQQQEVAQKYLGVNAGDLYETIKNMSLLLIERSNTFMYSKPELSNVITYNSLHITNEPPLLPKDLKDFLDSATEGFVYMSFGSSISLSMLSKEQLNTIITTFSKLPYKVLWKFDDENFPKKPDNVFIMKWFPQQGVLAHPNIKAFIYQGGAQSTDEAVHYAVPLIGIPLMYDQGYVINRLVEKGVARRVDFLNFSEANLATAIRDVLDNKRYKENMISLSKLTKDKAVDDIEKLVWWIEYVMRHNGAPHLRYNGAEQSFYKRYDTDIIVFFVVTIFTITIILLFVLVKCLCFIAWNRILINIIYKFEFCRNIVKEKTS